MGFERLLANTGDTTATEVELGGGMTGEILGGIAGVVLGILVLVNLLPTVLLPIAVIAMGAGLLLSSGASVRLSKFTMRRDLAHHQRGWWIAKEAVQTAAGFQVLAGLGGVVLGIIALVGTFPLTLSLVGLLAMGTAVLLTGAAVSGKMFYALSR